MPSARERQLLQVWNPLFHPLTVKLHVDQLLAAPESQKYVWWGRIYAGNKPGALTPAGAAEKWRHVADVAREMREARRDVVVLTTNFKSLHALRVDEIRFGADSVRDDGARVPAYYKEHRAAIWFRVRDVRPITHDQNATIAWLDANTLFDAGAPGYQPHPFDPFRAMRYDYPIALVSAPVTSLFDDSAFASDVPPNRRLFAAQPGTVFPPDLESAMSTLARDIDPPWSILDEASRVFLASASVVEALLRNDGAFRTMEPSAAMILMAKAVENECRALLRAVRDTARGRVADDIERAMLGDMSDAVRMLGPVARELGAVPLQALARNDAWLDWLTSFGRARNRAAHAERLPLDEFQAHRAAIFAKSSSRLVPLAMAKRDLQSRARA